MDVLCLGEKVMFSQEIIIKSLKYDAKKYSGHRTVPCPGPLSWVAGLQIYFSQQLAKQIPEVDFFSIQYPSEMLPEARTEILQIGNYEVLTVSIEHQEPYEGNGDRHTDHYWYWTDGDYFYSLNISDPELFGQDMPKEYMQKLMESVQPMEDMSPYSGVE